MSFPEGSEVPRSDGGHCPEPSKAKAIQTVPVAKNVSDVHRFLGMVNQLGKFLANLAEKTRPLQELLHKDRAWLWRTPQQEAFDKVKEALTTAPVLALFDVRHETIVPADV